jgi:cyanophycin synthetase
MEFLDARRLTGPSLLWDRPGSILDIGCDPSEVNGISELWESSVRRMLDAVDWSDQATCHRPLSGGVSLALSGPIDALYAASAINEWAWSVIENTAAGTGLPDFDEQAGMIRDAIAEEANPALLELERAARQHGVSFLWDDDEVSVGLGRGSETWPFRQLPAPAGLDWGRYHDIPAGIVTGTNGKTTTVRLATHIARGAARNVGVSCTDWIAVNDRIIERGDWSGPGGARNVLRQQEVDVAILETARGGLLRRGLGVTRADVALITNIAADHLGDFGSRSLDELLEIKWVVSRAVARDGWLVLNADDERLVARAADYAGKIAWFGLDPDNVTLRRHTAGGGLAFVLRDGDLVKLHGDSSDVLCAATDIPITMGGAARHNVANSLAAAALTDRLGIPLDAIRQGLTSMSQERNPGRCNVYDVSGTKVLVDFAHNPHAMRALFDMATAIPARRRLLAFGQAGDRPDDLIRELARSAWSIGLDAVIVSELEAYHRGRKHGEVYAVIRDELMHAGARGEQIRHFEQETESLEAALEWAGPGDLVIMLALGDSVAIQARLAGLSGA